MIELYISTKVKAFKTQVLKKWNHYLFSDMGAILCYS